MVCPASDGIPRAPPYSRTTAEPVIRRLRDSHPLRSPLPAAFGCITGFLLGDWSAVQPRWPSTPMTQRQQPSVTPSVWAPPGSLTATSGILSFPRGTEMFQFPRFPPPCLYIQHGVIRYHPDGVAPFGYPRIIAYPRLPEAFRGLVTSFFGSRCQGIHRVLFTRIRLPLPVQSEPAQRNRTHTCSQHNTPTHITGVPEYPLNQPESIPESQTSLISFHCYYPHPASYAAYQ